MAKKRAGKRLKLSTWEIVTAMIFIVAILALIALKNTTKEVTFAGCGNKLPNSKYSLRFPLYWLVNKSSEDLASTTYEIKGFNKVFTASCTNQGVGGGCESQNITKFKVEGKGVVACFFVDNGKWILNDFNLPTVKETNATISFWSEGLQKAEIEKILSSFKRL